MNDRELLVRRFNALLRWIWTYKRCQTMPNLDRNEIRRFQARIDRDVDEGLKVSRTIAELDMRRTAGARGSMNYPASWLAWSEQAGVFMNSARPAAEPSVR